MCLVQSGHHHHLIACNLLSPCNNWKIPLLALNNNHSLTIKCNLLSPCNSWTIPLLALNNNHSLTIECNLLSPCNSWTIPLLALNNNHSLTIYRLSFLFVAVLSIYRLDNSWTKITDKFVVKYMWSSLPLIQPFPPKTTFLIRPDWGSKILLTFSP